MEEWVYIVIGLVLLLLLFLANLIRAVAHHRRALREAHAARASSVLQGAVRYLDHDSGSSAAPSWAPADLAPVDLSPPQVPALSASAVAPASPPEPSALVDLTSCVEAAPSPGSAMPVEPTGQAEPVAPAEPSVAFPRREFVLPEVHRSRIPPSVAEPMPAPEEIAPSAPLQGAPKPERYTLVAPIEVHVAGAGRIAVQVDSPLYAAFLRAANLLLDDLAAARKS